MTGGSKRILAGLIIVVAGVVTATGVLLAQKVAQKDDDAGPKDEMQTVIEGAGYPWLGVQLKDVTAEQARDLKPGEEYGAVVDKVEADSPASKAGLQTGDVIVEFAGERVRSVAELRRLVRETPPGRAVEVRVRRGGGTKTLSATLESRPEGLGSWMSRMHDQLWPEVNIPAYAFSFHLGGPRLGISADRLTPQLAEYFGVNQGKGVLVLEVVPGSAAEKAGLKAGDCIVQVDSTPVESVMDLHRALAPKPGASREVTLTIVRDHRRQTIKAQIEARPPVGRRPAAESGSMEAPPGMMDPDNLESLEDEVGAVAPAAVDEARELASELTSEGSKFQQRAAEAAWQARELQKQMLEHKDEWQRELRQLGPEMQELQRELRSFRKMSPSSSRG